MTTDLGQLVPNDPEKGAITAEFATTLPAVVLLLSVVIAQAAAFSTQFRVSDAARAGARLAAIGVPQGEVTAAIGGMVAGQPEVSFHDDGAWITVTVRKTLRLGPVWLPPLSATGSATSWVEPLWGLP